jgi:hypothetical protein
MVDVLDETEKTRIKAEEVFRNSIRKELSLASVQPDVKKWYERVLAAANSNLGIWFLSAVLVTGVGTLYTNHQNARQEEAKKQEIKQEEARREKEISDRLALEISFRLSSVLSQLHAASIRFGETLDEKSHSAVVAAFGPLARPATDDVPPLFPEFKSYAGLALIAELCRHVDPGEKQTLKNILAKPGGLRYEGNGELNGKNLSAKAVASLLLARMQNPLWDKGFPYTDCKSENPFC